MTTVPAEARAFWVAAPGRGEIRRETLRAVARDEVMVRTLFSGVSRGTESLVFNGRVPPGERTRMRSPFQEGDFPAPVKYGYSNVGVVEEGAEVLRGRQVFALYPHQTRYIVRSESVFELPPGVPSARAVLAANMETAINGVWDGRPHSGDRIAVVGGGVVGCLVAWLTSRIVGCEVQLVDVDSRRATTAATLGVSFADPAGALDDRDMVFHASGSPAGLDVCLRLAGFETTIVEMSWYGDQVVAAPLGERFHSARLTIKSSQVGHVAASQRARWTNRRRMELALSLLTHPELDCLISGESEFDALPETMQHLSSNAGGALCHRIRY